MPDTPPPIDPARPAPREADATPGNAAGIAGGGARETAADLDARDPLRAFRDRFVAPDPGLVYLDGNSLGRLPRATAERLRRVVEDEWGGELIRGWARWIELPGRVGVSLVAEAGIEAIRAKSVALTEFAIALHDAWLAPLGCRLASPREAVRRGGHVSIGHPDAGRLCQRLVEAGVVPDFREPDLVRLGLSPLTTSFGDVERGLGRLREVLEGG